VGVCGRWRNPVGALWARGAAPARRRGRHALVVL